jgi:hypothetical protein
MILNIESLFNYENYKWREAKVIPYLESNLDCYFYGITLTKPMGKFSAGSKFTEAQVYLMNEQLVLNDSNGKEYNFDLRLEKGIFYADNV